MAATLAMGLVAIILSGTRGTLPGFGLMLLVAVLGGVEGNRRWWWTGGLFVAMVCVLALMWNVPWLAAQAPGGYPDGLAALRAGQRGFTHRGQAAVPGDGMACLCHASMDGVGLDRFAAQIQSLPQCGQDLGICQLGHAHNDLAQWSATLGIPGLLVIVAVYLVPLLLFLGLARRHARKSARGVAWAGLMLVLVFLLSGMTQSMFSHALSTMTYVVFVGLLLGLALRESTGRTAGPA